jgi:lipopolysaccharide export system protein LptC
MINRLPTLAPLVFIVLLAGGSLWLERSVQSQITPEKNTRHDPDFWAENFTIKKFNAEGILQNTLKASKMTHFPDDDTTIMANPVLTYHHTPAVTVSAVTGLISQNADEIALTGGAVVTREGVKAAPATDVATEILTLFPDAERAVTTKPVTITQGRSVIHGSGMESDHKTGVSILSGRVNGTVYTRKQ